MSIEKTREECFFLVGVNCFGVIVRSSPHIKGCRHDWWEDLPLVRDSQSVEKTRTEKTSNVKKMYVYMKRKFGKP